MLHRFPGTVFSDRLSTERSAVSPEKEHARAIQWSRLFLRISRERSPTLPDAKLSVVSWDLFLAARGGDVKGGIRGSKEAYFLPFLPSASIPNRRRGRRRRTR